MSNTFDNSFDVLDSFIKEDERLSVERLSFIKRLQTFSDPNLYFSKPLELSPLVCSRFGWSIHAKDLIKCDECKAKICIKFHPELVPDAKDQLTDEYRNMLATSHAQTCKYYFDAMRWLDRSGNKISTKKEVFVVPPYLLRLGIEFRLLQDQTTHRSFTRNHLLEEALMLSKFMSRQQDLDWSHIFDYELQKNVLERITFIQEMKQSIIPLFFDEIKDTYAQIDMTEESAYMVIFGWRSANTMCFVSGSQNDNNHIKRCCCLHVMCSICLAEVVVKSKECSEHNYWKRVRVEGEIHNSSSHFHLLHSHRVFCPYVKGFAKKETNISGTSAPCWTVVVNSLLERNNLIKDENPENGKKQTLEDRLGFIRNTLRSSIKTEVYK